MKIMCRKRQFSAHSKLAKSGEKKIRAARPVFYALMNYLYTHTRTSATTGYFECVPDPAPNLEQSLTIFKTRPFDTFLHRHILKLLSALNTEDFVALVGKTLKENDVFTGHILLEINEDKDCQPSVLFNLRHWLKQASLQECQDQELLHYPGNKQGMEKWRDIFYVNIHAHIQIPDKCESLFESNSCAEALELIKSRQGILQKMAALKKKAPASAEKTDLKEIYAQACRVMEKNRLAAGPEMRHEASLSPIALLRSWHLGAGVEGGRNRHTLKGVATAYGRGLSLVRARVSCAMEIIERASAHIVIKDDGKESTGKNKSVFASYEELERSGIKALEIPLFSDADSLENMHLHWLPGKTAKGEDCLAPAQAIYLFCNLDEPMLFEHIGSTGLAAYSNEAGAKLGALLEIIERDAHSTTPFAANACFELTSKDPVIHSLLEDYRWRGIRVQFQDITTEIGVPAYRCFVYGHDGSVAQASAANLCGPKAALAALTETPWPYVWANPVPAPSGPGLPNLPVRILEDLPDFSMPDPESSLDLLEEALLAMGLNPVYVNIGRPEYYFPVYRAFLPGLEIDPELEKGPGARLVARTCDIKKGFK